VVVHLDHVLMIYIAFSSPQADVAFAVAKVACGRSQRDIKRTIIYYHCSQSRANIKDQYSLQRVDHLQWLLPLGEDRTSLITIP
jgi:hypothetical protein